jgi:FAM192A/Fyv6, N-terminal domain
VAKQEAFEESIRLKNQFRALDDDEVDFLDSLLESTRAKEAAVKKETAEHLADYQRQREEAERALIEGPSGGHGPGSGTNLPGEEEQWAVGGRKRKRNKKDFLVPPKIRKSSSTVDDATPSAVPKAKPNTAVSSEGNTKPITATSQSAPKPGKAVSDEKIEGQGRGPLPGKSEPQHKAAAGPSLGLVAYDSDEYSD